MKLTSKSIAVTGGSSGLGLELSRQLVERGNVVVAVGRDPERLDHARQAIKGLKTFRADIADPAQRLELLDFVRKDLPSCDMLINNAGIMRAVDFNDAQEREALEAEIAINLEAPIQLTSLFIPVLRAQPAACIVNVSSGLAYAPFPVAPVYSATKAAMHSYTQSLRIQLKASGIGVVEVIPPGLDTPMITGDMRSAMAGQRMASAEQIAATIIRRIEAGDSEIAPGTSSMLRLMSRVAPGLLMRQMAAMYKRSPVSR